MARVARHIVPFAVIVAGLVAGCRDYHEPAAFSDCQPYRLQCATCTYADDAADDTDLQRIYVCELPDGELLDAVQRRAPDADADDTHFYDRGDGFREAAVRVHDEAIDVCGRDLREEWYGDILDCVPICEAADLPDADPDLPSCDDSLAG